MTPASPATPPDPAPGADVHADSDSDSGEEGSEAAGPTDGATGDDGSDAAGRTDPTDSDPATAALRAAFAHAAFDVTPGPVPLAAVRRAGRARRRRRTTAFSAFSVLAVASAVAAVVVLTPVRPAPSSSGPEPVAVPPTGVPSASAVSSPPAVRTSQAPPPPPVATTIEVVAAGERVDAGKGWKVWLTKEGKHWAGPDGYENSRSVTDGNIDLGSPGVSHQSEGDAAGVFHSGLYYGTRTAGRVELRNAAGRTIVATLLELPGKPGWGVWYAHGGAKDGEMSPVLYDRSGARIAELPLMPVGDPGNEDQNP
ncbi:hypothetical protein [Streptomyces venezuelae]|uniref:hypothetical protein n=1 Tax=Streptomyces venezuelae TaxID=54571 RepID=UPI00278C0B0A|nr:hypothetical protein [Streptomyces venezuelae]